MPRLYRITPRRVGQARTREARSRNPDDAAFPYWLARIDYDERRYADAISRFKESVKLDPKFVKGYDNLGLSLEANGDLQEAMQPIQKRRS